MADVVPGRRTMRYGVEVSWALPLYVAHSGEAKRLGASLSRRSWFLGHRASERRHTDGQHECWQLARGTRVFGVPG